ncbi:MAG: c-type cytochrome [Verrucomicrobiota bacterium]
MDYASGDPAPAHRWLLARDPAVSLAQLEAGRSRLLAAKRVMGPRDDWRQVGHFSEAHLRAQLAALAGAPALEAIFSPETLPPRLLRKSFRRQRPDDLEVIAIWSEGAGPSSRFFAWEDLRSHPAAFRSSSALEFAAEAYEVTGLPLADFVVAAGARGEVRLILADCTDTYQANFGSEMLGRRGAYLVLALGDQSVAEWAAAQGNPQWGPYLVTLQDFEGLLDPLNKQPWGVVRLQFRPAATPPWGAALAGAPRAAREGALIYRNTCLSCHAHDETYGGRVSNRSLAVLALHARTNRPYFERMLEAPEDTLATAAPMPAYPHYTKEEIDRLVAFLRVVGP